MAGIGQFEPARVRDFFRIGEVSRLTDTKPFVLRYWETEFPSLQPVKSAKGHRLYRREDVETVLVIKRLLYDEGSRLPGRAGTCATGPRRPFCRKTRRRMTLATPIRPRRNWPADLQPARQRVPSNRPQTSAEKFCSICATLFARS